MRKRADSVIKLCANSHVGIADFSLRRLLDTPQPQNLLKLLRSN